jgi:FkbM family methyltransferase
MIEIVENENVGETPNRRHSPMDIKRRMPEWLKKVALSKYNPAYFLWQNLKRKKMTGQNPPYCKRIPVVVDFMLYCLKNDIQMNTDSFFEEQDAEIRDFIDKKIKSFLTGFKDEPITEQRATVQRSENEYARKVRYKSGFFELSIDHNMYYLPQYEFTYQTFGYHYGLAFLPKHIIDRIKGCDILDIGAFYGDASIMFLQYEPSKIYAYEPVQASYNMLLKTIKRNAPDKIIPVKKGLGDKITTAEIAGNSSAASIIYRSTSDSETIEISTIDFECKNKHIGLVKMDVEGFEYYVIAGGLETIKRDKPILLISIYQTGKDFFEIMPLIRSCCPEYKFQFRDLAPNEKIGEKIIIAYTD